MYRDRIAEDVFVFTSDLYAQTTAGAIVTPEGAIVIDTLPFPEETRQMIEFIEQRCPAGIRYLILTHYHLDHTSGASLFKGVPIIAHARCYDLLSRTGAQLLEQEREHNPELEGVTLRLPDVLFDEGQMTLRLGNKSIVLASAPSHTADGLVVYVRDDKILFAADTMTPVPMIVDGDPRELTKSLRSLESFGTENIVQGHGEMILRGEVHETINGNIRYLNRIMALVADLRREAKPREEVMTHDIESCGKSRIPLYGLVQQFHLANLLSLYDRMQTDAELYQLGLRMIEEGMLPRPKVRESGTSSRRSTARKSTTRKTASTAKKNSRATTKTKSRAKTKVKTKSRRSASTSKRSTRSKKKAPRTKKKTQKKIARKTAKKTSRKR